MTGEDWTARPSLQEVARASIYEAGMEPLEVVERKIERGVDDWLRAVRNAVDDVRSYVHDTVRESKFMVDEFDSRVSDTAITITPSSREPVVYETIVAQSSVAATLLIGRRRITIAAGAPVSIGCKMRVTENEQRVLMTGTPEAPGAAGALYLELTGHIYPHIGP